ncbi:DUF448 domain-containing protein [Sphingomonas agri]|uniref:DUF448 domain-containing protein n=1 Tax=Sphingomonas agri TaxID=1813878 RepID=UPI00311D97D0
MRTKPNESLALAEREPHVPERTCVLTRRKGTRDELIRLALGPDDSVAPDVRARAPGRGAWIGVTRAELDAANSKGRLKGALQRAFKTNEVKIPSDLGERTEAALRQATLDRLGMEARSGKLVNGFERIENAARSGKVHLLIHAADAGDDGRRSLDQAWRVGGGGPQGVIFPDGRTILSMALGRENVVHVALTDPAAASRVRHALARWRAFTGPIRGPEGGEPTLRSGSAEED